MTDKQLYNALFPKDEWAPSLLRRARRLGIKAKKPADMTPEERARLVRLNIDPYTITWNRVLDVSDRSLRQVVCGLGGTRQRLSARDRLRHRRGQRGHGDLRARRRARKTCASA